MTYEGRHRRSVRLAHYDYTQCGAYFVTICTANRDCVFGAIVDGETHLSEWGTIAAEELMRGPDLNANLEMDAFVVMPNHIHAIWVIVEDGADGGHAMPGTGTATGTGTARRASTERRFGQSIAGSLAMFVGQYKGTVTRRIHRLPGCDEAIVWQRNYHEHIIRSPGDLQRIREYVANNPARWTADTYHTP